MSSGRVKMWEEEFDATGGTDELLAAWGYKVRSSDIADVAQKLEQLEMVMATSQEDGISHLASDAVHYNPTDLHGWVQSMLTELHGSPNCLDPSTLLANQQIDDPILAPAFSSVIPNANFSNSRRQIENQSHVKESEDQSAQETNISEEKRQLKANQTKTEIDENTGANPMINVQDFEDDSGELPIPCVPIVDTNKDELTKSLNETMSDLEILGALLTSSTDPEFINKQWPYNSSTISHETELANEISASESSLTGQQQLLGETEITNNETPRGIKGVQGSVEEDSKLENAKIVTSSAHSNPTSSLLGSLVTSLPIALPHGVKGSFEGSISENAKIVTSSTHSKLASSLPGMLVTSLPKAHPHIQRHIKFNQTETDIDRDIKAIPIINLEDFKDDDLISLLQSMEDDYGGELPIFSVPIAATTKDKLVAEALADLEDSLKMPLKDIVTSEANSLRLQTALNFLSRLSLDDGSLSHGLKAIIKSMHQDLPSILYSFKQAFATINKFAVLEERDKCIKEELAQRKEAAIALVSKMSKANKFMNEAQEKETRLKGQISRL